MVGGSRLDRILILKNGGSLGKRLDPQRDGRWEVGPKNRWLGNRDRCHTPCITYTSKAKTFIRLHVAA